jgi:hypothetical protein
MVQKKKKEKEKENKKEKEKKRPCLRRRPRLHCSST